MKQPETSLIFRKFENLSNIFYLMVGVPLIVFAWIYLNLKNIEPWDFFKDQLTGAFLHALIICIVIALTYRAYRKYKQQLANPDIPLGRFEDERQKLLEKVNYFSVASLQFYWSLTISTALVIIGFYLSTEEFYIGFYSILLILYSINRPNADSMTKDMKLKKEEQEALVEELRNPL